MDKLFCPKDKDYTFWGKGVSQGHSDAIRRIEGVKDAEQYTIPVEVALQSVRNGKIQSYQHTAGKHVRDVLLLLRKVLI